MNMKDPSGKKPLLEAVDLHKRYYLGGAIHAVDHVNLRIDEGEFITVVGPSGSGKSTLLGLLGALDVPTSGEVRLDGRNLAKLRSPQN